MAKFLDDTGLTYYNNLLHQKLIKCRTSYIVVGVDGYSASYISGTQTTIYEFVSDVYNKALTELEYLYNYTLSEMNDDIKIIKAELIVNWGIYQNVIFELRPLLSGNLTIPSDEFIAYFDVRFDGYPPVDYVAYFSTETGHPLKLYIKGANLSSASDRLYDMTFKLYYVGLGDLGQGDQPEPEPEPEPEAQEEEE